MMHPTILLLFACIHCHGNVFTESLPSNEREIHVQTHRQMGEIIKYTVEVGSGAMIYLPSFIKIDSDIQKLMGGGIQRQHGDLISFVCDLYRLLAY
jgi:hypothetical protein